MLDAEDFGVLLITLMCADLPAYLQLLEQLSASN
jgi:hypothetical protein